mmetsp:Transcript_98049/g.282832  ORF Transcript_98049/g.282832 Transcript_98049/m.282832 type:complete len:353 (-) Transcript_98049:57-1115(-)
MRHGRSDVGQGREHAIHHQTRRRDASVLRDGAKVLQRACHDRVVVDDTELSHDRGGLYGVLDAHGHLQVERLWRHLLLCVEVGQLRGESGVAFHALQASHRERGHEGGHDRRNITSLPHHVARRRRVGNGRDESHNRGRAKAFVVRVRRALRGGRRDPGSRPNQRRDRLGDVGHAWGHQGVEHGLGPVEAGLFARALVDGIRDDDPGARKVLHSGGRIQAAPCATGLPLAVEQLGDWPRDRLERTFARSEADQRHQLLGLLAGLLLLSVIRRARAISLGFPGQGLQEQLRGPHVLQGMRGKTWRWHRLRRGSPTSGSDAPKTHGQRGGASGEGADHGGRRLQHAMPWYRRRS